MAMFSRMAWSCKLWAAAVPFSAQAAFLPGDFIQRRHRAAGPGDVIALPKAGKAQAREDLRHAVHRLRRRGARAAGQAAHLPGHHGKTPALFACTRGLYRRIARQGVRHGHRRRPTQADDSKDGRRSMEHLGVGSNR